MTRQHFIAFAADIRTTVEHAKENAADPSAKIWREAATTQCNLVCRIAHLFNPRFDEKRFRAACGL